MFHCPTPVVDFAWAFGQETETMLHPSSKPLCIDPPKRHSPFSFPAKQNSSPTGSWHKVGNHIRKHRAAKKGHAPTTRYPPQYALQQEAGTQTSSDGSLEDASNTLYPPTLDTGSGHSTKAEVGISGDLHRQKEKHQEIPTPPSLKVIQRF